MEKDRQSIHFLDVRVYKDNEKSETDIYRKPTDSFNYLPFNSCHPQHIKRNIPFNLAYRIKRIVSDSEIRTKRLNELREILLRLKYPKELIDGGIKKANSYKNINKTDENKKSLLPFVTEYNPNNPKIFSEIIQPSAESLKLNNTFKDYKLKLSYKQPKSLLSLLQNKKQNIKGVEKCDDKRCKCCLHLLTGKEFTINGEKYSIRANMSCHSSNIIYMLKCNGCSDFYIGQSGDQLKNRMTVHRQHVNHPMSAPLNVSKHISRCAKDIADPKFMVLPLYQLHYSACKAERERHERKFILKFKPSLNASR